MTYTTTLQERNVAGLTLSPDQIWNVELSFIDMHILLAALNNYKLNALELTGNHAHTNAACELFDKFINAFIDDSVIGK